MARLFQIATSLQYYNIVVGTPRIWELVLVCRPWVISGTRMRGSLGCHTHTYARGQDPYVRSDQLKTCFLFPSSTPELGKGKKPQIALIPLLYDCFWLR